MSVLILHYSRAANLFSSLQSRRYVLRVLILAGNGMQWCCFRNTSNVLFSFYSNLINYQFYILYINNVKFINALTYCTDIDCISHDMSNKHDFVKHSSDPRLQATTFVFCLQQTPREWIITKIYSWSLTSNADAPFLTTRLPQIFVLIQAFILGATTSTETVMILK